MPPERRILYCHCAYAQVISKQVKQAVLEGLVEQEIEFDSVPDLCEMSARKDPMLKTLSETPNLRIAACYPRAVQGLFTSAGCPLSKEGPEIINMRTLNAEEVLVQLTTSTSAAPATAAEPENLPTAREAQ